MARTPSSGRRRTPQQRKRDAAARRAAHAEMPDAPAPSRVPDAAAPTPVEQPARRPGFGLLPRRVRTTQAHADAIADTEWTVRGRLTLALVIAVLMIPFGIVEYLPSAKDYPFAAYMVFTLAPISLVPIPLLLAAFVGMPVARALTREPRPYRVLETLGFAAVIDIVAIILWSGLLPRSSASFHDGKVVAAGALVDALTLAGGALLYGPISHYLSPRRRMRQRP